MSGNATKDARIWNQKHGAQLVLTRTWVGGHRGLAFVSHFLESVPAFAIRPNGVVEVHFIVITNWTKIQQI